jgi:acetyltransferase-like isoleucine patch superfamily enzyme
MKHFLKGQLKLWRDRWKLDRIAASAQNARIDPRAIIRVSPTCKLMLGRDISISAFVLILLELDPNASASSGCIVLEIGDATYIGEFTNIRAAGRSSIGKNCLIAQGVSIIGSNHSTEPGIPMTEQASRTDRLGFTIEDDVWIGTNVTILPGIRVGKGAIVAAGSVVTKDVAPGTIVAGVPASFLRNR